MVNKFYTFNYPRVRRFEIEFISDKDEIDVKSGDDRFLETLFYFSGSSNGSKKTIEAFLDFQLQNTKASKSDFLDHTESIFNPRKNELLPHSLAIGYVRDWIQRNRSKIQTRVKKEIERVAIKNDPSFNEIVIDKDAIKDILTRLKTKDVIADNIWRGIHERNRKSELVAFYYILVERKLIKRLPYSALGRIFSKEFACPMNARNYTMAPKNETIERVKREI